MCEGINLSTLNIQHERNPSVLTEAAQPQSRRPIKDALTGGRRASSIQPSRSGAPALSGKTPPLCIIVRRATQISAQGWKSRPPTQRFCKTHGQKTSPSSRLNERPCRRYLSSSKKVLVTVLNTLKTKLGDIKPIQQVDGDSALLSHQRQQLILASD